MSETPEVKITVTTTTEGQAVKPSALCMQLLRSMTPHERGAIFCWFCSNCYRYVGPGDACRCSK